MCAKSLQSPRVKFRSYNRFLKQLIYPTSFEFRYDFWSKAQVIVYRNPVPNAGIKKFISKDWDQWCGLQVSEKDLYENDILGNSEGDRYLCANFGGSWVLEPFGKDADTCQYISEESVRDLIIVGNQHEKENLPDNQGRV